MAEIAIPKVWRSEVRLVLMYLITSCMSIYLSYLLPWTIVVGRLFTTGETQVMLHLPLLWFIPLGFLSTAIFRLYDVSYLIDTDGIEAKIGLLNFRKRIVRVRFEDIRSVKTHQDLIGRLFDIGQIEIRTAATSDLEIFLEGVSAPLEIHSMIESEKAQRQHLTGRLAKDLSAAPSKKGKVAFVILLANLISFPWNPANAVPDNNGKITSIRDVRQNESQSLRESVSKSTLEGDEDLKLRQNKLQDEEKRLRTAEENLLKKTPDKTEKNAPIPSKAKPPQPTRAAVQPTATPKEIPSPQPTIVKYSVATPTPRPSKEKPESVEAIERTEPVKPVLASSGSETGTKKATSDKPAASSGADISRLNAENSRLRDEIEALKLKTKTELAEVDDLRVKLMVAETQIERLNRIIEECSQKGDGFSNYRSGAQEKNSNDGTSNSLYATVIANSITPRTGPGNSFAPISSLRRGQKVPVENRQGDWYKVRLPNGAFAWVHSALIKVGAGGDNFDLPGTEPPPDIQQAPRRVITKKPTGEPPQVPDERLEDVDKEAFRLLEKLKIEREAESGS